MENVTILDHPMIKHKLSILRSETTGTMQFRQLISEIGTILTVEATKDLPLEKTTTKTPLMKTETQQLLGRKIAIVPILRAGLGMMDGVLNVIPNAKVGHIGMARDHETLKPVTYYCNLPEHCDERIVMVLDPMLATGGSGAAAIKFLKDKGCKHIKFLSIIAAPEGIKRLHEEHPDVQIYCAYQDEKLNEHGYILPGLGDAGDRIFGTL